MACLCVCATEFSTHGAWSAFSYVFSVLRVGLLDPPCPEQGTLITHHYSSTEKTFLKSGYILLSNIH